MRTRASQLQTHTRSPRQAAWRPLKRQHVRSVPQQAAQQAARPLRMATRSPRQAASNGFSRGGKPDRCRSRQHGKQKAARPQQMHTRSPKRAAWRLLKGRNVGQCRSRRHGRRRGRCDRTRARKGGQRGGCSESRNFDQCRSRRHDRWRGRCTGTRTRQGGRRGSRSRGNKSSINAAQAARREARPPHMRARASQLQAHTRSPRQAAWRSLKRQQL